ncbi:hypothetical protein G6F35_018187 [Rhizopus arrhizus]|nr:hypothetical protein G6F24_018453 [Rhizopus arrhizus]KAG1166440.1 hypothetical protein G6F35_018187 [Rhizopus arrhizus]
MPVIQPQHARLEVRQPLVQQVMHGGEVRVDVRVRDAGQGVVDHDRSWAAVQAGADARNNGSSARRKTGGNSTGWLLARSTYAWV